MRPLDMETRVARASDGTEFPYLVTSGQGPWILLVNGLAASHKLWHHVIDYLRDQYRFLTWDPRGLYDSDSDPRPSHGSSPVADHARDLRAVLATENIERATWMAWSAGAQIALEALPELSDRVSHLVLLNPTFGAMPFGPLAPVRSSVAPRFLALLERSHRLSGAVVHRAARWPESPSWLQRLGLVGPTIEEEALAEVAAAFGKLNMHAFFHNLHAFESHDPSPRVDQTRVPTLLVTGQRDLVSPRDAIEAASRRIPGSETFVIRGASHYAPLEFPELINLRIEKFLRERSA